MVNRGFLTEFGKVILSTPPVDTTGAAITGLWIDMSKYQRCTFIIAIGNQTTISTPAVTLRQATDAAGTGAKTLSFDWQVNNGSTALSQSNDTMQRVAVSSDTFNIAALDNSLYMIDLRDTQLDIGSNFRYVQLNVASPGANACPISILAVLYDGDWATQPANQPTVVA